MIGKRKLLFAFVAVALLAGPVMAQWGTDTRVDTDSTANFREFSNVCEGGDNIYASWLDYRPPGSYYIPALYFNYSNNNGSTWGAPDQVVNTGVVQGTAAPDFPVMACDPTGQYVYCAWQDYRNDPIDQSTNGTMPNVYFNRSTNFGASFETSDQMIDTGSDPNSHKVRYVDICAAGSNVYIQWVDFRVGNKPSVYSSISANYGASGSWTTPQPVDPTGSLLFNQDYAVLACSGLDVYSGWQDNREAGSVYFNHSSDGGVTWTSSTVRRMDTDTTGGSSIYLEIGAAAPTAGKKGRGGPGIRGVAKVQGEAAPANSNSFPSEPVPATKPVYAVWRDYRNGSEADIYFNYSKDNGLTWGGADQRMDIHTAPGSTWTARPKVAGSKNWVYVVWMDAINDPTPGQFPYIDDIYCRLSNNYGQSTWSNPIWMSDGVAVGAFNSQWPQVSASYPYVYVTFEDERDDPVNFYESVYCKHSTNGGISWSAAERVDGGAPSYGLYPINFCEGNHLNVIWYDYRTGARGIYWNGRTF